MKCPQCKKPLIGSACMNDLRLKRDYYQGIDQNEQDIMMTSWPRKVFASLDYVFNCSDCGILIKKTETRVYHEDKSR